MDLGLTLHLSEIRDLAMVIHDDVPLREKREDPILAFLREPSLTRNIHLSLLEVDLEDFGGEVGNKMLSKRPVICLKAAGKL